MPFDNLAANHYQPEEIKKTHELLKQLQDVLQDRFVNLNEEERMKYASVNEKNKLVVNKVKDYYENEPDLCCDEIDWKEFMLDYADRAFLSATIKTMQRIIKGMDNKRILHDYDNFKASRRDYEYAQFKNNGTDPRFEKKVKELAQFFEKSSKNDDKKDDDNNEIPDDLDAE